MLSFIQRNLHIQLTHVKTQAYRMYIRSILEYSSTVWAPYTKCNPKASSQICYGGLYSYGSIYVVYHPCRIQRLKWNSLSIQEETYPDLLSFIKFCTRQSTSHYRTILFYYLRIQLSVEDTIQDATNRN